MKRYNLFNLCIEICKFINLHVKLINKHLSEILKCIKSQKSHVTINKRSI